MHIEIDGDGFRSVLLNRTEWKQFVTDLEPLFEDNRIFTFCATILREDKEGYIAIGSTIKNGHNHAPYMRLVPSDIQDFSTGWRPVLIPDIPFDEKDMPNGSIMTGGSIYFALPGEDGKRIDRPGLNDPYPYREDSTIWIGDTGEKEQALRWIVWNGYLVCQNVLFRHISGDQLKKMNIH